jgi:4-oxalomesaconate hydratase
MQQMKTTLVISAHAADFCSRAGGTITKLVRLGESVHVIDLTMGERGESEEFWQAQNGGTVDACKLLRRDEAERSAAVLGCTIEFADFNDYPLLINGERLRWLAERIQDVRPRLVLTHWPDDPFNVDHQETSTATVRAISCAIVSGFRPGKRIQRPDVYFFEASVPITEFNRFQPDTYVDITDVFSVKMEALRQLASQPFLPDWYTRYAEQRGYQAATWAENPRIRYAEAFKRYTPYVGLVLPIIEKGETK